MNAVELYAGAAIGGTIWIVLMLGVVRVLQAIEDRSAGRARAAARARFRGEGQ